MLRKFTILALFTSLLAAGIPAASASSDRVGSYIVVLKDSVDDPRAVAREHSRSQNARLGHVYEHALKGYSATMSDVAAARIASDRRVSYVEADGAVHKVDTQANPPSWGLDRIDDALGLDKSYDYTAAGAGVRAYVIDSGITSHSDFSTRLVQGKDFVDGDTDASDCDGHGTHVAGTIGGTHYGVAKAVTLVPVRVLNCSGSGTWSGVIAGIDWVAGDVATAGTRAVANMSLGGGYNSSVNEAVENSSADGVVHAVAAGNGNQGGKAQDACNSSPASAPSALTVGATNSSDSKASWSNYGTCLDLFAPGVSITSTTMDGKTATWSGTSMATPHVAGVAALYLQGNAAADVATVTGAITGSATPKVVSNAGPGSPNLLLYSLLSSGGTTPTEPANAAPSVTVTSPTDKSTVSGTSVAVGATVTDTDGTVTKVEFYVGSATAPFATDSDGTDGWTATWDSTSVADGSYILRAVATDNELATGSHSVGVTVDNVADSPASAATAAAIGYSTTGGKFSDKHLTLRAVLTDDGGNLVANTSIEVWIYLNGSHGWTGTGTTLGDGSVTWEIKNAPSGTYTTTVKNVAGAPWTGTTQDGDTNTGFSKT